MSDIVERLTTYLADAGPDFVPVHPEAISVARDEIVRLRAERDRLREALTPSTETKAAYMGEFQFPIQTIDQDHRGDTMEVARHITVPWTTVKEIMAAIHARAALRSALSKGAAPKVGDTP